MSQYNQPIYVSSSSSQSLNQQQIHTAPVQNQNGPIYVSSNVVTPTPQIVPMVTSAAPPPPAMQQPPGNFFHPIIFTG